MNYLPLDSSLVDPKISDMCGLKKHVFFAKLLLEYRKISKKSSDISTEDIDPMFDLATSDNFKSIFNSDFDFDYDNKMTKDLIHKFVRSLGTELISVTSIIGGMVASEGLKLTGKYTPIDQWYGYDQVQYLPLEVETLEEDSRYYDYSVVYGKDVQAKLSALNVFVPGAGAIGCEVLK